MRIGLYGLPSSGKTHILSQIEYMDVLSGSTILHQHTPNFDLLDEDGKMQARRFVANSLLTKPNFIMDGHYAFGNDIAFTEEDGRMYDAFIYLSVDPNTLQRRMATSQKNAKYTNFDIRKWQELEIVNLRAYCHSNGKDFYIIDNPPYNVFDDVADIIDFIRALTLGFSCRSFAHRCAQDILRFSSGDTVTLLDGDKTLTIEDSSSKVLGYKTNLYDGNFYTGYQSWKQGKDFQTLVCPFFEDMPVQINDSILRRITGSSYILTSGHEQIWNYISEQLGIPVYCGIEMAAETKLFITQELQRAGKHVIAYGDGMNDYYMLKQADESFLVAKQDGSISRSLREKNLEGITVV